MTASPSLLQRYQGCLLGLACGDAVGTTVEFEPRGSFDLVTDMVGGGPFGLEPGQWTDDTSMALCLGESLLAMRAHDPADQLARYLRWMNDGHWSATGHCFDIGMTTASALEHFAATGDPAAGPKEPDTAGNGSLMRLAPVVLFFHPDAARVEHHAAASSLTTHGAAEAVACCRLLARRLNACLAGQTREAVLAEPVDGLAEPAVQALARRRLADRPRARIRGTGYCVESLEAAMWAFATTDSFEAAILAAANLGDDADTTAAITGQLAGAYYGVDGIPPSWLARLHASEEIRQMATDLFDAARTAP